MSWRVHLTGMDWVVLAYPILSMLVFFPLLLLLLNEFALSPWALVLFVVSLMVLFFLAVDQVRKATPESFLLLAFQRGSTLPSHWNPYLRDMASSALRKSDLGDLSQILAVIADTSPKYAPGVNISFELLPLVWEIPTDGDLREAELFLRASQGLAEPLGLPPFPRLRDQQEWAMARLRARGDDLRKLLAASQNPSYREGTAEAGGRFFHFTLLLTELLRPRGQETPARNASIRRTLISVLLNYYVWSLAESRDEPAFDSDGEAGWPYTLVGLVKALDMRFTDLGEAVRAFGASLRDLQHGLGDPDEERLEQELRLLVGRAWNKMVADCYRQVFGLAPGLYMAFFFDINAGLPIFRSAPSEAYPAPDSPEA